MPKFRSLLRRSRDEKVYLPDNEGFTIDDDGNSLYHPVIAPFVKSRALN